MLDIPRRQAVIGVINSRAENHGKEHTPAVDIPIKFECDAKKYLPVFLRGASETSVDAFWMATDGSVRFPNLAPLEMKGKIENVDLIISQEELSERITTTLHEGKIMGVTLTPKNDHKMLVSLKYQCRPGDDDWKNIMHLMKEECWIQMIERQRTLDLEAGKDEAEKADEPEEEAAEA